MMASPQFHFIRLYALIPSIVLGWTSLSLAHGDYHDVLAEVEGALKKSPEDADLHFRLAVAYEEHGEWSSALVALERTERLAPGKHPVALIQGLALAKGGRWEPAEAMLNEFLGRHPNHGKALIERARVRLKLMRPAEAIQDFQAALTTSSPPAADWFLETAEVLVSQGHRAEAIAVLNQGMLKLDNPFELLESAVEIEAADGQFDAAIKHIDSLSRSVQRPQEWLARKARLLAHAGRQEASQTTWRELRDHLLALPNLERGQPAISHLLREAQTALGEQPTPAVVMAPPAVTKPLQSVPKPLQVQPFSPRP